MLYTSLTVYNVYYYVSRLSLICGTFSDDFNLMV